MRDGWSSKPRVIGCPDSVECPWIGAPLSEEHYHFLRADSTIGPVVVSLGTFGTSSFDVVGVAIGPHVLAIEPYWIRQREPIR